MSLKVKIIISFFVGLLFTILIAAFFSNKTHVTIKHVNLRNEGCVIQSPEGKPFDLAKIEHSGQQIVIPKGSFINTQCIID